MCGRAKRGKESQSLPSARRRVGAAPATATIKDHAVILPQACEKSATGFTEFRHFVKEIKISRSEWARVFHVISRGLV